MILDPNVRATSHTRLRARDHYTSSTLTGRKGRDQRSMWMQDGRKVLHGYLHGIEWIMFHGHSDYSQLPPLGGRPNTKPRDHGTPNAHNHWFILFNHEWGPAWIEIQWNSLRLRARSHMTSHYTRRYMTTLHDFGGVLGRPSDTFLWHPTISWSRLLARVWSGPKPTYYYPPKIARLTMPGVSVPVHEVRFSVALFSLESLIALITSTPEYCTHTHTHRVSDGWISAPFCVQAGYR